jgi:exonuclease SbcC
LNIERVVAEAFGPLRNQTLELTPGLNVVFGPNEAGKSSWHAALTVALCGTRRGTGAATKEARQFARRHRPWSGAEWSVSTVVVLDTGRRIRLSQDLDGHVDCQAIEVAVGRDISDEVMFQGAPDGSKFLGLDRRAFASTACIRQADLQSVTEDAAALQVHIQRAAAARGTDATAASALRLIDDFKREHVGRAQANSTKPLQAAIRRVDRGRTALENARMLHQEVTRREREVADAQEIAEQLKQRVTTLEETRERKRLEKLEQDLERAEQLARKVPEAPAEVTASPEIDQAREALAGWGAAPASADVSGTTAAELTERLQGLPETSVSDEESDPAVGNAETTYEDAVRRLEIHDTREPPSNSETAAGSLSASELREMATLLREPRPQSPPEALRTKRDEAAEAVRRAHSGRRPLVIGAAVSVAAGAGGILINPILGIALIAAGIGLGAVWALAASRLARMESALRTLETEIGSGVYAEKAWEDRRSPIVIKLQAAALPADADELAALADRLETADRARLDRTVWETERAALVEHLKSSAETLANELDRHQAASESDLLERAQRYRADCAAVRNRRLLKQELRAREALESSAALREQALEHLREAAAACGLDHGNDPDSLVTDLRAWLSQTEAMIEEARDGLEAWTELRTILRDSSLEELRDEVAGLRERVGSSVLATAFGSETEGAYDDGVERAREEADAAASEAGELAGRLGQFLATAPSVAEAEEEFRASQETLERVKVLEDSLDITARFLEQAQDQVHRDIAPVLAATINTYLPRITGGRYGHAAVDPKSLLVRVQDEHGQLREAGLLSHGTAEQIYLLLRVALAQHLTAPGETCPLILDDVTAQSDATRTKSILEVLHELSADRQIVFFTQEDDVRDWAEDHLGPPRDGIQYVGIDG